MDLANFAQLSPAMLTEGAVGASRRIPTNVGNLAVYDTGTPSSTNHARILVLWPAIMTDHRIYSAQVAALRARHRMVLIDGPGHGASGPPNGDLTMAHCARAVLEVLDALRIVQPVVGVGTSWGGLVASELALRHPERTQGVVLLNTPVFRSRARMRDCFTVWGARWLKGTNVFAQGVAEAYFMPETRKRETDFMEVFSRHIQDSDGAALSRVARAVLLEREELASRLENIAAPTLFVAGTNDPMYSVEEMRREAARLPRGQFVEVATAHVSVVDAPFQTTLAIDSFLKGL